MKRSGPPPLAASSSNFLNRSSNLTSWIVELEVGVGRLDLVGDRLEGGRLGAGAGAVRVPDGELAAQGAGAGAAEPLDGGRRDGAAPPLADGDGVAAPLLQAASDDGERRRARPSTRSLPVHVLSISSRLRSDGRRGRPLVVRSTAEPGVRSSTLRPGGPRLAWTFGLPRSPPLLLRHRRGRCPDDEPRRQPAMTGGLLAAGEHGQQEARGLLALAADGLMDGGEWRVGRLRRARCRRSRRR